MRANGEKINRLLSVEETGARHPDTFCLQIEEIALIHIPAKNFRGIPERKSPLIQRVDPSQIPLRLERVIPCGANDNQIETRPADRWVIPERKKHACAGLTKSPRRQSIAHG